MISSGFLVVCFGAALQTSAGEKPLLNLNQAWGYFEEFMLQYRRYYHTESEKLRRFEVFKENMVQINENNLADKYAVYGIGRFSDLTPEEFTQSHSCLSSNWTAYGSCDVVTDVESGNAPQSFDWRSKKVVTRVKDQGYCGSCWAFSTTGNIEGQHAIKYGELVVLSEQQLVDCDTKNSGCSGGSMISALSTLQEMGGLQTETDYPYKGTEMTCSFDKSKVKTKLVGCNEYHIKDEDKLKELLHKTGPIAIALAASQLKNYSGGIVTDCRKTPIDHAVLLVGYGTENGVPFWIVKNSWDTTWGENGYVRLQRGVNMCGMMSDPMASAVLA